MVRDKRTNVNKSPRIIGNWYNGKTILSSSDEWKTL
jgi:hypothetical protein